MFGHGRYAVGFPYVGGGLRMVIGLVWPDAVLELDAALRVWIQPCVSLLADVFRSARALHCARDESGRGRCGPARFSFRVRSTLLEMELRSVRLAWRGSFRPRSN